MPVSVSMPYDDCDLALTPSPDMVALHIDSGEGKSLVPSEDWRCGVEKSSRRPGRTLYPQITVPFYRITHNSILFSNSDKNFRTGRSQCSCRRWWNLTDIRVSFTISTGRSSPPSCI